MSAGKPGAKAPQEQIAKKTKPKDLAPNTRAEQRVKGGQVTQYIGETEKNLRKS
jgi:hypothetical protein